MDFYNRASLSLTVLVFETGSVLATARLGTELRRVAARLSTSAYRKHQYPSLGHRMRQRHLHAERSTRGNVCFDPEAEATRATGERAHGLQERRGNRVA